MKEHHAYIMGRYTHNMHIMFMRHFRLLVKKLAALQEEQKLELSLWLQQVRTLKM